MPAKLLIADDSADIRMVLKAILAREGHRITQAETGMQAVRLAREQTPDLILLDVQMPEKTGYEACEELQKHEETRQIPILFISGADDASSKIKGLDLGAVDYITKPFNREEVIARVRTQLRIRELTRSLIETNRELLRKQCSLDEDLRAAAQIQLSLMPRSVPVFSNLRIAWRFQPCQEVGGDLVNLVPLSPHHVAAYILDVSGHGVPAAMLTVSVSQSLSPQMGIILRPRESMAGPGSSDERSSDLPESIVPPGEVLTRLDREYPIERFQKHLTLCYLIVDKRDGTIRYSLAGHPPPFLLRRDGKIEMLYKGGTIIGLNNVLPFEEGRVQVLPGDRLLLYTDGLIEHQNEEGEFYGETRVLDLLLSSRDQELGVSCDRLFDSLLAFSHGVQPIDDVTFLYLEYRSGPPP